MNKVMAFFAFCALNGCAGGDIASVPALDLTNFDTTAAPSHDFYQYATGGWQKKNPLTDEYARYGAFDVIRTNNELRIKELFAQMVEKRGVAGSVEQKIADLYTMGLDSVKLNREGFEPIQSDLAAITALKSRSEVIDYIGVMHKDVANPFFGSYVDADPTNSSQNLLCFVQAGLGMGNRDYYLDDANKEIRQEYSQFIETLFSLAGFDNSGAKKGVQSVLEIENAIAKASSSNVELRNPIANYNLFSKAELKAKFSSINWDNYAKSLGVDLPEKVNVCQPKQLNGVNTLLKSTDIETLKDYLRFNLLRSSAPYLGDDAIEASFNFYGKTMSGKVVNQPRWKRALALPNSSLSEAVGEVYVQKYFPAENKQRMETMVENLRKALGKHIDALEWMSDATKAKAHEKLSTFYVKIGYPNKWKDYSLLEVDSNKSYWQNVKAVATWATADNFSKLSKPVDRDEWYMSPQTVNAYYNPPTNEICFPAAILQPPFFNPDGDDAVNYGAIGVVIGHEMTHGFDDQGRQYDKDGNLSDWWTKEDAEAFNERAQKLVKQFDGVEVLPNLFANGAFTLGENIADQGGLRVAYTALKESQKGVEPAKIDGLNSSERFYLGYATVWAQNIRDEEIARLTKIDPHSLGKWRVNQTLKNIDDFYETFNILDGEMFLNPQERVVIW